jgi:hypothetical protein
LPLRYAARPVAAATEAAAVAAIIAMSRAIGCGEAVREWGSLKGSKRTEKATKLGRVLPNLENDE